MERRNSLPHKRVLTQPLRVLLCAVETRASLVELVLAFQSGRGGALEEAYDLGLCQRFEGADGFEGLVEYPLTVDAGNLCGDGKTEVGHSVGEGKGGDVTPSVVDGIVQFSADGRPLPLRFLQQVEKPRSDQIGVGFSQCTADQLATRALSDSVIVHVEPTPIGIYDRKDARDGVDQRLESTGAFQELSETGGKRRLALSLGDMLPVEGQVDEGPLPER